MIDAPNRRCDTCRHWEAEYMHGQYAVCGVMNTLKLPFWLDGHDFAGRDHQDWLMSWEGSQCKTWEEMEDPEQ